MQKPLNNEQICCVCNKEIAPHEIRHQYEGQIFCLPCYEEASAIGAKLAKAAKAGHTWTNKLKKDGGIGEPQKAEYNKPDHYHTQSVDTIAFLQEGFPPSVFVGFALGSAIKYLQRYEYKNGYEDLDKAMDYILRLKEFLKVKDLL